MRTNCERFNEIERKWTHSESSCSKSTNSDYAREVHEMSTYESRQKERGFICDITISTWAKSYIHSLTLSVCDTERERERQRQLYSLHHRHTGFAANERSTRLNFGWQRGAASGWAQMDTHLRNSFVQMQASKPSERSIRTKWCVMSAHVCGFARALSLTVVITEIVVKVELY